MNDVHDRQRYRDGYRNGRTDARLGVRLTIALTSPNADYRDGYRRGHAEVLASRKRQTTTAPAGDGRCAHVSPLT